MKVKVTQSHIKRGNKGQANSCPIALAVQEAIKESCLPKFFGKITEVVVDESSRVQFDNGCEFSFDDDRFADFIQNFDEGKKVKPFQFDLLF